VQRKFLKRQNTTLVADNSESLFVFYCFYFGGIPLESYHLACKALNLWL
jgi:hypothetical protein